jgi:PBP1b-binding outer membrane lipoprotein LpoB
MKILSLLATALLAAGCASQDVQVAQAPVTCKVAPITTASATDSSAKKPVSSIRQREAEMDLASSQYRMQQLNRNGNFNNNVEDALRNCDTALK